MLFIADLDLFGHFFRFRTTYAPHGRCFYTDENKVMMPMGRELKEGFSTSLRLVNGNNMDLANPTVQLTMNIDCMHNFD